MASQWPALIICSAQLRCYVSRSTPWHLLYQWNLSILDKFVPADKSVNAWVCQSVKRLLKISDLQELLRVCEVQGKIKFLL